VGGEGRVYQRPMAGLEGREGEVRMEESEECDGRQLEISRLRGAHVGRSS
jgi:hypothetical protein